MRRTALFLFTAVALAGCTPSAPAGDGVPSTPTPTPTPTLEAGQRVLLLDALRAVSPRLVADEPFAVSAAQGLCADIKESKPAAELSNNARVRFTSAADTRITVQEAAGILRAVRTSICAAPSSPAGTATPR